MPIIQDDNKTILAEKSYGLPEFDEEVSLKDLTMAAFRTENSVGSAISRANAGRLPGGIVRNEDFNPWDHLSKQEQQDEKFLQTAMLADDLEELDNARKLTQKERKDRNTLAKGGAMSFVVNLGISGVADPINLIPVGGTTVKTYRAGESILKSAVVTGSTAAASTALQETALHATQLERTFGESALNVSGAFLLGGILGGGAASLKGFGKAAEDLEKSFDVEKNLSEEKSLSAAASMEDVQIKGGKALKGFIKGVSFDPLTRLLSSDNPFARKYTNLLAENVYEMDKGAVTAVESLAKIHDGKFVAALETHNQQLLNLRKRLGQSRLDTLTRRGMTKSSFNELVAKELRNPDPAAIPEVKAAAQAWEQKLYSPLRDELIAAKLLPEDVSVSTATNYLNRVWNSNKIAANMDQFVSKVSRWLEDQDTELFNKAKQASTKLKSATTKAEKADLEKVIKKAGFKEKLDFEKQDYEDVARQIAQRIMGSPDGKLPYDYKLGEGSKAFPVKGTKLKGPLKERTFNIPDKLVDEFLDNDIEELGGRYLKQVATDLEIVRAFGGEDVMLQSQVKDIQDWWSKKIEEASKDKTSKGQRQVRKLKKQMEKDLTDFTSIRDRMRGTFGRVDHNNPWVRTGRAIRDLNYLRFMGGVMPSSVADMARTFMSEGFVNTFKHGLVPLAKNLKQFKIAASEGKAYGIGVDALTGGRSEILADVADYSKGGTAVERGLRTAADKFGRINLMDFWNAGMKQLHLVTMQNSVIESLSKGKIDKRLRRLGISDDNALNIAEQVKKHGKKVDGVWLSGAKNWDSPELERIWGAALRKESDRVIVVPGQEKPLFMSTEMGKAFLQFRSFMLSSTQRMLIAGIQGQDHNYLGGMLMGTTLGMMTYAFKQWDAGRDISDDPKVWISEGIDRSGNLGLIMEMNNTLEKISLNNYGLRPLLNVSAPSSRFASRSTAEGLLGPTFGSFATTTLKVLGAGADDNPWTEKDTRTLRRLLPYQNLMILRQLFDKIEKSL